MNELYHPAIRELALEILNNEVVLSHVDPECEEEPEPEEQMEDTYACSVCINSTVDDILVKEDERLSGFSRKELKQELPEALRGVFGEHQQNE